MQAIGFPTYRYKLVVLRHRRRVCGLAGALLANHTDFVSPAMMHWTRSGDLMVMVILGGMGTLFGPLLGAVASLVLEEAFAVAAAPKHWQIDPGPAAAPDRAVRARRHRRACCGRPRRG